MAKQEKQQKKEAPADTAATSAPVVAPTAVEPTTSAATSTALVPKTETAPAVVADPLAGIVRVGADGFADVDFDAAEKIGDKVSGGFDGPHWVPFHHPERSPLKAEELAKVLDKLKPGGGIVRQQIAGTLVAMFAWGRRAYFLDVIADGKEIRVKMPEHWSFYAGANLIAVGTKIAVRYDGRGKAKDGKQAPHLYSVIALQKGCTGNRPRKDALSIESIDDRKKRIAREKAREEERRAALEAEDAALGGETYADDVPF